MCARNFVCTFLSFIFFLKVYLILGFTVICLFVLFSSVHGEPFQDTVCLVHICTKLNEIECLHVYRPDVVRPFFLEIRFKTLAKKKCLIFRILRKEEAIELFSCIILYEYQEVINETP